MKRITLLATVLFACIYGQGHAQCTGPFTATYSENFDGATAPALPVCWAEIATSTTTIQTVTSTDDGSSIPSAPNAVEINSVDGAILVSPQFSDLPSGQNRVRVKIAYEGATTTFTDTLFVGVMANQTDATTFVKLYTLVIPGTAPKGFDTYNFNLNNTALIGSNTYVGFQYKNGGGAYEFYVDDFFYEPLPSCLAPTGLAVSNIATTTANLSWNTEPGATNGYVWSVFNSGDDPTTATPVATGATASGTTTATATGLTPNTKYEAYVQSDCGANGTSILAGPVAFTTACVPVNSFSENFDLVPAGDLPDCWDGRSSTGTSTFVSVQNQSLEFSRDSGPSTLYGIAPVLSNLSAGTHQLRFMASTEAGVTFEVGTLSDPKDVTTYTSVQAITTTTTYQEFIIPIGSTTDDYIAFKSDFTTTFVEGNIDDVFWEVIPPCPKPSDLSVNNIAQTTADLSWTAVANASSGYIWSVYADGVAPGGATPPVATGTTASGTTTATAMGLAAQTAYDAYVKADCGASDGQSILTGPVDFTTLVPCPAPANLTITGKTTTTADLSWDAVGNATNGYIWSVYADGVAPGGATPPVATGTTASGTTTATAMGLTANTDYDAYVQSDCAPANGQSSLAGPVDFTTACAPFGSFTEDFEASSGTNIPDCWSEIIVPTGAANLEVEGSGGVGSSNQFEFDENSQNNVDMYFITPQLSDLQAGTHQLRFFATGDIGPIFEVGTITDPTDPTTFTPVLSIPVPQEYREFVIPFTAPPPGDYIAFKGSFGPATGEQVINIDNVAWEASTFEYVYTSASGWAPSDPSGNSTSADDILVVDGTATISADTQMNNLTINGGATLNIQASILPSGNIVNNGNMVFINDAVKLGQLADMTGSAITGEGETTVQRFIPARNDNKAAYRYIASAVNSTGDINSDWQEGAATIADNPNPGFGMFITGAVSEVNGFDATPAGAPSVFEFDYASQTYVGIPNTDASMLQAGHPYVAYVWGDRGVDIIATDGDPVATNTTLRATGSLVIGNQSYISVTSTAAGEFYFFGNPYQAIVDMNDVLAGSTNLNTNFYYVWDPNLGTRGAYATVDLTAGTTSPGTSAANQYLQPGQAAFVATAAAGTASILFEETDKDVAQTPTDVFRPQNLASIELQLFQTSFFQNGGPLSDAVRLNFSQGESNAILLNDAPKLGNFDENIAVVNGTELLSIENRALPTDGEVLQLHNDQYRVSDYTFKAIVNALPANVVAYLNDAYLGTQIKLINGQETIIAFSVDAGIPASIAPNRFSIEFKVNSLSVDEALATGFELYPNPAENGEFFIVAPGISGETQIALYNLLGQKVRSMVEEMGSDGRIRVEAHQLEAGVYMVELSHEGKTFTKKLIVQ